jgi:hypothetical protein
MKVIRAPPEHQWTKKAVSTSYVFRFLVPLFVCSVKSLKIIDPTSTFL